MTTTLPDPVTGTDAGTSEGLRAEADRLAAMPRSWAPSISELLDDEARRLETGRQNTREHDTEPPQPSTARPTPTVTRTARPTLADLDRVLDRLAANETRVATLHAERASLLADAIRLAEALETDLLDPDDPTARRAPSARRLELAHRAVTAEIATTLHIGEHAAGSLTDHARTLTAKAPATLQALSDGRLSWAHATAITKHVADLDPDQAAHVERSVLAAVISPDDGPGATARTVTCTPAQVARRARRARETTHPVPADVRHTEAAQQRAVYLDDGHDGMAWLVAHLPAPLAHAAHDRLTRSGRHLVADGDPRTLAQARADTLAALLLDDGTLDHGAPPAPARQAARHDNEPRHDSARSNDTATRTPAPTVTFTTLRPGTRPTCWPRWPARSGPRSPSPSRS
ncbi:DUF222 domain-containing protein [Isoptericola sp. NPDC019482]|uniref:DUF222 domain-containing protein n=1 Tax=Isoptericola sp. NPDC019482 TaxID=3154688 RepID=UPI00346CEAF6